MSFSEPSESTGGDRFAAEDAQNRRLIVVPVEYVPSIRTARGDQTDAIRLNVVDLQGGFNPAKGQNDPPAAYLGTLWFGGRLIRAFRDKLGEMFVGYVSKVATSGGFKAWQFSSLTQDQETVNLANNWLQANPDFIETCQSDVAIAAERAQQPPQQPQQQQWQGQPQQQVTPMPGPAGMPMQAQQAPQGPAPLPPQQQGYSPDPHPTPRHPQQGPAPMGPPAQAQSVMERLRAQKEQEQDQQNTLEGDQPSQLPF